MKRAQSGFFYYSNFLDICNFQLKLYGGSIEKPSQPKLQTEEFQTELAVKSSNTPSSCIEGLKCAGIFEIVPHVYSP